MNNDELFEKLWDAVMCRAERVKAQPVNYVWTTDFGRDRKLYVNGTKARVEVEGVALPPFNALLIWNGWPVALFDSFAGVVMAPAAAEQWAEVVETIRNS